MEDEISLRHEADKLRAAGISICMWTEPDRDNSLTAFSSEPISGERRRLFKHLQLLKGPPETVAA